MSNERPLQDVLDEHTAAMKAMTASLEAATTAINNLIAIRVEEHRNAAPTSRKRKRRKDAAVPTRPRPTDTPVMEQAQAAVNNIIQARGFEKAVEVIQALWMDSTNAPKAPALKRIAQGDHWIWYNRKGTWGPVVRDSKYTCLARIDDALQLASSNGKH